MTVQGGTPIGRIRARLRGIPLAARMLFYGVFFLAAVLIALPWLASRIDVYLPQWHREIGWLRLPGAAVFAAFLFIYLRTSVLLSRQGRGAYVEFDPPAELVTDGPFRWCRNPIAGCVVGMIWGLAFALSSTGVLLLALIAVPLAHVQVVALEEPLLRKRFGSAYEQYMYQVPRWIPRRPRGMAS